MILNSGVVRPIQFLNSQDDPESAMSDQDFRAANHYVPQSYLSQWCHSGKLWAYRLLVPTTKVPIWEQKSPRSVAGVMHLYTGTDNGEFDDDLERWFEREYETPAAPAIRKVISDEQLTNNDWYVLVRFLAAQDLRTPRAYTDHVQQLDKMLPGLIQTVLKDSIQKFTEARRLGIPIQPSQPNNPEIPVRVTKNLERSEIGIEALNGRKVWLSEIKRMLETTARFLHQHQWTILRPPVGVNLLTSDNPVIHLGYTHPSQYKLERAWAAPKMNIMLPLGPHHLLFTQVGDSAVPYGTRMSDEQAILIRRVTSENAFRMIFAVEADHEVEKFRPRRVDLKQFQTERAQWRNWHEEQSKAENEFDRGN